MDERQRQQRTAAEQEAFKPALLPGMRTASRPASDDRRGVVRRTLKKRLEDVMATAGRRSTHGS